MRISGNLFFLDTHVRHHSHQ